MRCTTASLAVNRLSSLLQGSSPAFAAATVRVAVLKPLAMLLPLLLQLACASDMAFDARILLHTHDRVGSLCAGLSAAWLHGLAELSPALLLLLLLLCVATAGTVSDVLAAIL
jgi:hypothetical protein